MILPHREYHAGQQRMLSGIFYSLVLAFVSLYFSLSLSAQTLRITDTARGSVGDAMFIALVLKDVGTIDFTLQGTFKLSNPTVFYPQRFSADSTIAINNTTLTRRTDSTYAFSLSGRRLQPSTEVGTISLWGEALAGSDSLCTVFFDSLSINNTLVSPLNGTIITTSIGTPLPYVRFATLEVGYPNPTAPGTTTTWAYRIDKASAVTFISYDLLGREIRRDVIEKQVLGVHLYQITPGLDFPVGVYTLRMKTNTGEALQRFVVVN